MFFGKEFEFRVHFGHSTPYGGNPPIHTPQTGWRGVQITAKMDENTIGIVFGCFGQGIRISGTFWSSDPLWWSPTPNILSNRVEGVGASYRQNLGKHNRYGFRVFLGKEFEFRVHFVHLTPYGGHPPQKYPQCLPILFCSGFGGKLFPPSPCGMDIYGVDDRRRGSSA